MCNCGVEFSCYGGCECGCGHDSDSYVSWNLGYAQGRRDAGNSVNLMMDVDPGCMEEIESDPQLNESYILVRRIDAALVARGEGQDE